jgi:Ecdysteroid kinase-like family
MVAFAMSRWIVHALNWSRASSGCGLRTAARRASSLILKIGVRMNRDSEIGRREVEFYKQVAPLASTSLVPRCFDAVLDTETKEWHLVLEDLTGTHVIATAWPLPPSFEQCQLMVDALARIHAEWWDHPRLGICAFSSADSIVATTVLMLILSSKSLIEF